jgi:hypothetical protein
MAKRNRDLLDEIEQAAMDESVPITRALLKCLSLGGQAGSAELREWASRELHGYLGHEKELPDYRIIRSPLLMDGFGDGGQWRGRLVSVIDLPEEVRKDVGEEVELTHAIGKIEGLVRQAESKDGFVSLTPASSAELALWMTHEIGRMRVVSVYWRVSAADFRGVIEGVRTILIELVAEMRAGTAPGAPVPPAEVATQALHIAVYGDKNRFTLNTAMAEDGGTATVTPQADEVEEPGFWTATRIAWSAIIGIATIVGAVAAVWALHPHWHL